MYCHFNSTPTYYFKLMALSYQIRGILGTTWRLSLPLQTGTDSWGYIVLYLTNRCQNAIVWMNHLRWHLSVWKTNHQIIKLVSLRWYTEGLFLTIIKHSSSAGVSCSSRQWSWLSLLSASVLVLTHTVNQWITCQSRPAILDNGLANPLELYIQHPSTPQLLATCVTFPKWSHYETIYQRRWESILTLTIFAMKVKLKQT